MNKVILHADVNNFFASCAIELNPALQDKEVIICGDPEKRHGIVLAKSNMAKKKGIITGDTLFEAKRKAPNLIVVPPDFKQYMKFSKLIYNIYIQYTPYVESFGLDECWLDVTGCEKEYGSGENLANIIKERIKTEVGLTISIGVSFTKIFAKLGSDLKKPDAVSVISRENYKEVVWSLKAKDLLFIGKSTEQKLSQIGINTIGDLANTSKKQLQEIFGKVGEKLHDAANGIEDDQVNPYNYVDIPESISNGSTTVEDIRDLNSATILIYSLSEVVAFRLRKYGLYARGVALTARDSNLNTFTRQQQLITHTSNAKVIAENAISILQKNYSFTKNPPLRMITVGAFKLIHKDDYAQSTLFEEENIKEINIDEKIDNLRSRYGYGILKRGIEMDDTYSCDVKIDDGFLPFDKTKHTPE